MCSDGELPCTCQDNAGVYAWVCTECEDEGGEGEGEGDTGVNCVTNPNSTVCNQNASCIGCHGLQTSSAGAGIENSHPWVYVGCTTCHGGVGQDPNNPANQLSKEESHVPIPEAIAAPNSPDLPDRSAYANYYLARAGLENLEGGLEWLRFVNPGDLRIVEQSCAAAGCHVGSGETVRRSTMASAVGKLDGLGYGLGIPRAPGHSEELGDDSYGKHLATYGSMDVEDPDWDRDTSPPGSVPKLTKITSVDREDERPYGVFDEYDVIKDTLNKVCGTCHLGTSGKNQQYGNFRASGCTACHMAYDWSGQSQSGDPMIPKQEPTYPAAYQQIQYPERPHPPRHLLRRNQTAKDCLACHTGSARLIFQYMGIRTDDNRDLTRARQNGVNINFQYSNLIDNDTNADQRLHGFTQDQLIEFEDLDQDGRDDTPADVHYEAGMECVDCHNASDMHGDGRIYSRQSQAVKIKCVSCHGSLEYEADPDASDNPINERYFATGNPARKNLFRFDDIPTYGEPGYGSVTYAGVWLRTKSRNEWKYVSQIKWGVQWDANTGDCIGDGRRTDPRTGGFVCRPQSSIAHGRWQGTNLASGDFDDGVGPRPNIEVIQGASGANSQVRFGFSHLGEETSRPNEGHSAGLECIACHGTWNGQRFGNHFGLTDVKNGGTERAYDWDRANGEITIGTQGWFNFTFMTYLDQQLGVTHNGKIGWLTPARLKMFFRSQVFNTQTGAASEFMREVGDESHDWKTYRDRIGMGNVMHESVSGIDNAPGWQSTCLEPEGFCDQDTRKNVNGGLGEDTMGPHASTLRAKNCTDCHLSAGGGGLNRISAVFGWNPNGFTAETSAYLATIDEVVAPHGTYSTANGFVIADDGIQHRLDWMVDEDDGFPYVWSPLVRLDDGREDRLNRGYDTYDPDASGPITKPMIDLLKRVWVENPQD